MVEAESSTRYPLEETWVPEVVVVEEADVTTIGDALEGYYAESVGAIARVTGVPERDIRDWFDRHLIAQ